MVFRSDFGKAKANQSLQKKSGKKLDGQVRHVGSTLYFSACPDEINHIPDYCQGCGLNLIALPAAELSRRQLVLAQPTTGNVKVAKGCGHRIPFRNICLTAGQDDRYLKRTSKAFEKSRITMRDELEAAERDSLLSRTDNETDD
ncbi:hypothetical protein FQR65_LT17741 [Abscondita terminalis]|nr:hypothetical protein FQR65_LT17741 [Abscondita terminalis]